MLFVFDAGLQVICNRQHGHKGRGIPVFIEGRSDRQVIEERAAVFAVIDDIDLRRQPIFDRVSDGGHRRRVCQRALQETAVPADSL